MPVTSEMLYDIFRRNFPHAVREERTARRILSDPANRIFAEYDGEAPVGVAVVNQNNVLMLAVEAPYRRRGIGSRLLLQAEQAIKAAGYDEMSIGVGNTYLTPGVPTGKKVYEETLRGEEIYPGETDEAARFFEKRGYFHAEGEANIFDMRLCWKDFPTPPIRIGESLNGVTYRFATREDMAGIKVCTDDAEEGFTKYYMEPELYAGGGRRVLVADCAGEIAGTLMVEMETEAAGLGSVGCTAVKNAFRGRHIATNMVMLGTGYLKEQGMASAYLGYTYSGLDKLYGASGYKACIYYFMAHKKL